jgi:hypothetical protein
VSSGRIQMWVSIACTIVGWISMFVGLAGIIAGVTVFILHAANSTEHTMHDEMHKT